MKQRFIVILSICSIILCGCQQKRVSIKELLVERDSLMLENISQRAQLEDLSSFMETINLCLDSISVQENFLRIENSESPMTNRSKMKADLDDLIDLVSRQKDKISCLEDSLKNMESASAQYRLVVHLKEQLQEKEEEITKLREQISHNKVEITRMKSQISDLNQNLEELDSLSKEQQEILNIQTEMLNEGFVKIGTRQQLRSEGILLPFPSSKLNPTSMTKEKFQSVDIRTFTEIQIESSNPKVLTTMPKDSYSITTRGKQSVLTILDPAKFWSASNFLIIATN